jgi:hypothetical protein
MNFSHTARRVLVVIIAIGFLQGCNNSNPAPDTAKSQPVSPVLIKLEKTPQKQEGRGVPKSIKRR